MRLLFPLLAALGLSFVVVGAGWLLLQACGVRLPLFGTAITFCTPGDTLATRDRLAALDAENAALNDQILALERELQRYQCTAQYDEPEPLTLPPPPVEERADRIDEDAWNDRDIGLLEGCWDLDSQFSTTNRQTGRVTNYNEWQMCFDQAGRGREVLRATGGATCEGPISGRFNADGQLAIEEPANLRCSDGGGIYRMTSLCDLNPDGTASCNVTHPEIGGSFAVQFRRALGAP